MTKPVKHRSQDRRRRSAPLEGSKVVWPKGIEQRLGVSHATRWRMERDGRLPPRDFFIGQKAVGWRPATLEAAARGEAGS